MPAYDFVFCVECTKIQECEKAINDYIDGCNEGKAYYNDPKSSGSEDK